MNNPDHILTWVSIKQMHELSWLMRVLKNNIENGHTKEYLLTDVDAVSDGIDRMLVSGIWHQAIKS